ncbi:MAG: hypothetical protein ABII26_09710 [Pseudomonadota bacterium]
MGDKQRPEGMLTGYRVLDLTDEKGLLCGKILGDLGAGRLGLRPSHRGSNVPMSSTRLLSNGQLPTLPPHF